MPLLLAADIGGTKSDLAITDLNKGPEAVWLSRKRYKNREFPNFDSVLTDFLKRSPTPDYGCLGVAAVIRDETAELTNFNWVLDGQKLKNDFGFQDVRLINDLSAVCAALPHLKRSDLITIQQGRNATGGVQSVIAPGTGLGEGFLLNRDDCYFPQGSEGGHCDFAPLTPEQEKLLCHVQQKSKPVSYEMLCSGLGIPNIYDYFATTDISRDEKLYSLIANSGDKTPPIVEGAQGQSPCPLCVKTVAVFLEILGAEAGNLALKTYSTGGLFIGGGIVPRIIQHVSFESFLVNFCQKEKMEDLMRSIPVHIIIKKDSALLGSVSYGHHLYNRL